MHDGSSSFCFFANSKMTLADRGTAPYRSAFAIDPNIDHDLPAPVCPYAKIVQLMPSTKRSTMLNTARLQKYSCVVVPSNT